jgi:hypothetical protein
MQRQAEVASDAREDMRHPVGGRELRELLETAQTAVEDAHEISRRVAHSGCAT